MSVTTAQIRAREAQRGKKAFTGIDNAGELHYAFDNATLQSIIMKANNDFADAQSAKAYDAVRQQTAANNQFNAEQAAKQMAFQRDMSSTAHQREVKDLIAAGLNPVLSANGGASTPSGSTASADTSGSTAKLQLALQQMQAGVALQQTRENIASAQKMAKWQNDLNKEIASAQLANQKDIARIQAAASMYGADQSSSASRYSAELSQAASEYASDTSRYNSRMDRFLRNREYTSPHNSYGFTYAVAKFLVGASAKAYYNFLDTTKKSFDLMYDNAKQRSSRSRHR